MSVKYKNNLNKISKLKENLKKISGKKIQVGYTEGKESFLAELNEYGCNIDVTPDVRKLFNNAGIELDEGLTKVILPEKAFLRIGYDEVKNIVFNKIGSMMGSVIDGRFDSKDFMEGLAVFIKDNLQEKAANINNNQSSKSKADKKGNSLSVSGLELDMNSVFGYEVK